MLFCLSLISFSSANTSRGVFLVNFTKTVDQLLNGQTFSTLKKSFFQTPWKTYFETPLSRIKFLFVSEKKNGKLLWSFEGDEKFSKEIKKAKTKKSLKIFRLVTIFSRRESFLLKIFRFLGQFLNTLIP